LFSDLENRAYAGIINSSLEIIDEKIKSRMESIIQLLQYITIVYLVIGLLFSIFLYKKGMALIDENTIGSSIGFKLIIFPGILALWPFLLIKFKKTNLP